MYLGTYHQITNRNGEVMHIQVCAFDTGILDISIAVARECWNGGRICSARYDATILKISAIPIMRLCPHSAVNGRQVAKESINYRCGDAIEPQSFLQCVA